MQLLRASKPALPLFFFAHSTKNARTSLLDACQRWKVHPERQEKNNAHQYESGNKAQPNTKIKGKPHPRGSCLHHLVRGFFSTAECIGCILERSSYLGVGLLPVAL
jgi:hypothetical protein